MLFGGLGVVCRKNGRAWSASPRRLIRPHGVAKENEVGGPSRIRPTTAKTVGRGRPRRADLSGRMALRKKMKWADRAGSALPPQKRVGRGGLAAPRYPHYRGTDVLSAVFSIAFGRFTISP